MLLCNQILMDGSRLPIISIHSTDFSFHVFLLSLSSFLKAFICQKSIELLGSIANLVDLIFHCHFMPSRYRSRLKLAFTDVRRCTSSFVHFSILFYTHVGKCISFQAVVLGLYSCTAPALLNTTEDRSMLKCLQWIHKCAHSIFLNLKYVSYCGQM